MTAPSIITAGRPASSHRGTAAEHRDGSVPLLLRRPAWVIRNSRERQRACTEPHRGVGVQLGVKKSVEAIDNAAVSNGKAQLDHLLGVEVSTEFCEERVGDRSHSGACLRKTNDGRLGRAVDTLRKRVIPQVGDFRVGQSGVSTETDVGGNSVVTIVGHRRSEISELSLIRADVGQWCRLRTQVEKRLHEIRVVGKSTQHVHIGTEAVADREQQGAGFGVGVGIVRIDQLDAGHRSTIRPVGGRCSQVGPTR